MVYLHRLLCNSIVMLLTDINKQHPNSISRSRFPKHYFPVLGLQNRSGTSLNAPGVFVALHLQVEMVKTIVQSMESKQLLFSFCFCLCHVGKLFCQPFGEKHISEACTRNTHLTIVFLKLVHQAKPNVSHSACIYSLFVYWLYFRL